MTRQDPTVSIGLPVYNGEKYLREAVDSLLGQTFPDIELIISDNASTDQTADICREYMERDSRVSYHRNEANLGLAANYNRVVELARGRYFKWASANDICEPEMIAECVKVLEAQSDVVLCYPRTVLFDEQSSTEYEYEDGLNLSQESPPERVKGLVASLKLNNAMNGLIRLEALRRTDCIAPFVASDVNLMVELSLLGKFHEVPEPLFRRRMHPKEATRNGNMRQLIKIYDPSTRNRQPLPFWRLNWEHMRAVWRSPVRLADKFSLTLFLSKKFFWDRRQLAAELVVLTKRERG